MEYPDPIVSSLSTLVSQQPSNEYYLLDLDLSVMFDSKTKQQNPEPVIETPRPTVCLPKFNLVGKLEQIFEDDLIILNPFFHEYAWELKYGKRKPLKAVRFALLELSPESHELPNCRRGKDGDKPNEKQPYGHLHLRSCPNFTSESVESLGKPYWLKRAKYIHCMQQDGNLPAT